jgi:hypothetical protein
VYGIDLLAIAALELHRVVIESSIGAS